MKTVFKIAGIGFVLLAVLALGVTLVLAQEPAPEAEPAEVPEWGGPFGGRGRMGHGGMGFAPDGGMFDTLAEQFGMTIEEIMTELRSGISVAELAESNGVDVEALIDALTADAREKITERVQTPWTGGFAGMRGGSLVSTLAELLEMDVADVVTELQTGISIAELAESHGLEPQQVVDAFLADHQAMLDAAVESGRITQEQADEMQAHMAEEIAERITEPWSAGNCGSGMRPGGFGGHGMRGGQGMWGGQPGGDSPRGPSF